MIYQTILRVAIIIIIIINTIIIITIIISVLHLEKKSNKIQIKYD